MPGWSTSRAFTDAITNTPCGCELARQAKRETDPTIKEDLEQQATEAQQAWCCPVAGHEPGPGPLPSSHRTALRLITQVIGESLPPTCPRSHLYNEAVIHANRCYQQNNKGEMVAIYGDPTIVLMEAVDLIAQGYCDRQQWDWDNPPPRDDDK